METIFTGNARLCHHVWHRSWREKWWINAEERWQSPDALSWVELFLFLTFSLACWQLAGPPAAPQSSSLWRDVSEHTTSNPRVPVPQDARLHSTSHTSVLKWVDIVFFLLTHKIQRHYIDLTLSVHLDCFSRLCINLQFYDHFEGDGPLSWLQKEKVSMRF